jgi:predicted transcriptional regulator
MDYNEDYPSEVTLWVDDREAGTVRLPGDMGARYGRHTPAWVPDWHTKYGFLTTWTVDDTGSQVNEEPASPLTLDDLRLDPGRPITVRFGFRQGDVHGGMNLFGGNFGDHGQAIRMKLTTRPAKTPAELLLDEMQSLLVTETAAESSAERAQNEGASPAETVRE